MTKKEIRPLWNEHRERIIQLFKRGGVPQEEAEDLSQEVFYKLLKKLEANSKIYNLGSWINTAARNKLVDFYRLRNSMKQVEGLPESGYQQSLETDEEFRNCLEQEVMYCFNYFLKELDAESQFILTAVELENKSQKMLAVEMGISYPTLRSKVQRARQKIREKFFEACTINFDPAGRIASCTAKC